MLETSGSSVRYRRRLSTRCVLGNEGNLMWTLAYDDDCAGCRGIAAAVMEATGGLLEVVSLHDRKVFDAVRRSGRQADRPTLVGPADDAVFQGASLGWHMVRLIGVRRAIRVLRLMGEDRQRSSSHNGLTRRGLLSSGGKVLMGAFIAGSALSSSAAANAEGSKENGSDLRRLRGTEFANAVREADADPSVLRLVHALEQSGYAGYERISATAVSASDPLGRTVTWLPLWHAQTATLAIIAFRSWRRSASQVMLLQEKDGQVGAAVDAPAAQDAVVQAAFDGGCLATCVSTICPGCAVVCAFTGPFWPTCVLNCCGVGVLSCYFFLC